MKDHKNILFHRLIADENFKDWVLFHNSSRNYIWDNRNEHHPQELEQILLAKEFILRMRFKESHLNASELDDLLIKIIAKEERPITHQVQIGRWFLIWGPWIKIAGILVICLISVLLLRYRDGKSFKKETAQNAEWEIKMNQRGEKSFFLLPDGSLVHLNYESQISYPQIFEGDKRVVELIGEAFFEVAKDPKKPFIVKVNNIETEVLGTSFNIRSLKNNKKTEISLVTGNLRVTTNDNPMNYIFLSPGDQLNYDNRTKNLIKDRYNLELVTSWKDGIIIFEDASFEEFVDKLERWYGVDFRLFGDLSVKWKINGRYENEKLDDILKGISFMYGIEYKINGKDVTLKLK